MSGEANIVRPASGSAGTQGDHTPEPGSVHVLTGRERTRVVLSGEVDAELGPALLESAAEVADAAVAVEVDMQHVTFMDSTGVAFLARLARESGSPVQVLRPTPEVRFLLDITGVATLVEVLDPRPDTDTNPTAAHPPH